MTSHPLKRIQTTVLLGTLAAMLPATASAASIFTNFGPSLSYDVTQGNLVGNDFSGDNLAQGDSFTPSATAVFSSATLALSCVTGCPAAMNFTIDLTADLTADNSDSPGSTIEGFSLTGLTLDALGNNNTPITVHSVLQPTLVAGTRYWMTVSSSVNYSIAWNNNSTGDTNDQAVSSDGGATWFAPSGAAPSALEVDGNVAATPEPSTAAFLAVGGLLLGWARNRFSARGSAFDHEHGE